jgi:hypothetical protein
MHLFKKNAFQLKVDYKVLEISFKLSIANLIKAKSRSGTLKIAMNEKNKASGVQTCSFAFVY